MLERQDDRRPRGQQRRQHSNKRDDVSCVVVLIWLVLALIGTNRPAGVRKDRDRRTRRAVVEAKVLVL